ncbi:CaiB/BaiF CoA-transferase family protein [Arthrobacter sp. ISL-28]|uniref:CaiB/BaiF CoA transferase family protein n=1 Tax=Arthrobacter sp. ISL-28 TaxID=2819108 RepID=UPI001BE60E9C|nr:CaiB/BaiF CoA-transferase family protein [Arthrobacter sp. ISL-28]MBT2523328.1 CoA transferase [Arthrobacter sp. ISL-28]
MTSSKGGPLTGFRVLEMASLGPVPFAAMMLADLGADVVRIDRPASAAGLDTGDPTEQILFRGRPSVCVDATAPRGRDLVLELCSRSDVLLEGNRPGVMERLGLGPEECLKSNPQLIYGRATGWGQDGPLAPRAGHDINYSSLTGALHATGEAGRKPVPALNLVSDFGGGGTFLMIGVLSALLERAGSGAGQVVDAAMIDGASYLMTSIYSMLNSGEWNLARGSNLIDGGVPFYDTYRCSDGEHVAVGALEPKFWATLVRTLELPVDPATQWDRSTWPDVRALLERTFAAAPRDAWVARVEGTDSCLTPVLSVAEAPNHPHSIARAAHRSRTPGSVEPAPAPRFSRTPGSIGTAPQRVGESTTAVLRSFGFNPQEINRLEADNVVFQAKTESE